MRIIPTVISDAMRSAPRADDARSAGASHATTPAPRLGPERPLIYSRRQRTLDALRRMLCGGNAQPEAQGRENRDSRSASAALAEYRQQMEALNNRLRKLPLEILEQILGHVPGTADQLEQPLSPEVRELAADVLRARREAGPLLERAGRIGQIQELSVRFDEFFAVISQAEKDRRHGGNFESVVTAAAESLFGSLPREDALSEGGQRVLFGSPPANADRSVADEGKLLSTLDRLLPLLPTMGMECRVRTRRAVLNMLSLPAGRTLPGAAGKLVRSIEATKDYWEKERAMVAFASAAMTCRDFRVLHDGLRFLGSSIDSIEDANVQNLMACAAEGFDRLRWHNRPLEGRPLRELVDFANSLCDRYLTHPGIDIEAAIANRAKIQEFQAYVERSQPSS